MKTIKINEYPNDGILIDLEDEYTYQQKHINGSINIPYQNIIYNFQNILDKNKKYYFYCNRGNKSRKLVSILDIYGYDATQVIIN